MMAKIWFYLSEFTLIGSCVGILFFRDRFKKLLSNRKVISYPLLGMLFIISAMFILYQRLNISNLVKILTTLLKGAS